jgi:putative DNA primase/helicase
LPESPSYYPKNHGQDLTDWFVRHGRNVAELHDLLAQALVVEKPQEPKTDPGVLRFFKGRKFMPALLTKAIMEDMAIVSDPLTGLVYRWEGRFWDEYGRDHIEQKALLMLGDEGNSAKAADVANMICKLSTLPLGRKMNEAPDLTCLENGMLNLVTGDLLPHQKEYYASYMMPIAFDPRNVQDCPRWKKFLLEGIGDHAVIREVQKFFGYCLTRDTKYEKMLIVWGPGGDGKSKLLKVLKALVGAKNVTHIPMARLEDQFYLSKLVDKLLNTFTEVEQKAMQSQEIKAIVSGDPISASFKNQTPFDFDPVCKLAYSTNRFPRMLDNSDGFFRKIMIVEMTRQFVKTGTADIDLEAKLLEELPGVFAWALAGLAMLRADKGFGEPAAMKASLDGYKTINNNVLYFIKRRIEPDPAGREYKSGKGCVYEVYRDWCKEMGLGALGEPEFCREFSRQLRDMGVLVKDGKKDRVIGLGGLTRRANAYSGFSIVEEKPEGIDDPTPPPRSPSAGGAS